MRETVLDQTLPGELRTAHSGAATALLSSPRPHRTDRTAAIGHHLRAGGRSAEAWPFTLDAARHAASVWAVSEARVLYSWLCEHAQPPDGGPAGGTDRVALLRAAATASRWSGHLQDALALLDQAADGSPSPEVLLLDLELNHGQIHWAAGDMAAAPQAYERAAALAPSVANPRLRVAASPR